MLRVGGLGSQLARECGGQQERQVHSRRIEERRHRLDALGGVGEQHRSGTALAEQAFVEVARRRRAERDLAGLRDCLGVDAGGRVGTGDDQLAVDPAHQEEVELAAVHADRDAQPHGAGRRGAPPHALESLLHAHRRRSRAQRVVLAPEQQQDGVATELEQVGVVGVGTADQLGEGGVDHAGDLLRTFPAALRERLGEIGEAGDVGEDDRPLEALCTQRRRVAQPVDRDPRDERPEWIRRLETRASLDLHRIDAVVPLNARPIAARMDRYGTASRWRARARRLTA